MFTRTLSALALTAGLCFSSLAFAAPAQPVKASETQVKTHKKVISHKVVGKQQVAPSNKMQRQPRVAAAKVTRTRANTQGKRTVRGAKVTKPLSVAK